MLAIDELSEERRQELADQVHQMQVKGEIWAFSSHVEAFFRLLKWTLEEIPDDFGAVQSQSESD